MKKTITKITLAIAALVLLGFNQVNAQALGKANTNSIDGFVSAGFNYSSLSKKGLIDLPQKSVTYNWDAANKKWSNTPNGSSSITYTQTGQISTIYGINTTGDTTVRNTITYDNYGSYLTVKLEQKDGNGKWIFLDGYKWLPTYNGNKATEVIFQSWKDNLSIYRNRNKNIFTYDGQGRMIGSVTIDWDTVTNTFKDTSWIATDMVWYQWNGNSFNSKLLSDNHKIIYKGKLSSNSNPGKNTRAYDLQGNIIEQKQEELNDNKVWEIYQWSKFTYTYDGQKITEKITATLQTSMDTIPTNEYKEVFSDFIQVNSVKEKEIASTNIYPNPSFGIFTISSSQAIANIDVFDVTGKLVYSQQNTKKTNAPLDLSNLSNGIYFINVNTENGQSSSNKIVITK